MNVIILKYYVDPAAIRHSLRYYILVCTPTHGATVTATGPAATFAPTATYGSTPALMKKIRLAVTTVPDLALQPPKGALCCFFWIMLYDVESWVENIGRVRRKGFILKIIGSARRCGTPAARVTIGGP